ncbi:MAG: tripartite tricarboxylate transporter permease, partial [Pseudomonadota bacterium]
RLFMLILVPISPLTLRLKLVLFGLAATVLRLLSFPMAPMILGFILGGMMEENLRRALLINNDSWSFLWERPLTLSILLIAAACLLVPMITPLLKRMRNQTKEGPSAD